ncbi:MAG: asparagine synthase (glutamine-hydrolyzing) [Lachnospiraceae bacterium]|nr:asparagine synthase (glutamine-hydrolyzing) [Lachnospiraceae bacterium]
MCGICGYVSKNFISYEALVSMTDSMEKRGPDGHGFWQDRIDGKYVGLGHRRLSIFDLSDNGKQPMMSEDERISITYNGEIYNFIEIRKELENIGYRFSSKCDTEVILKAYSEWGTASFARFNGMFAFAILDRSRNMLIICRDRLGVKPLYYGVSDNGVYFASDMSAIMRYPEFEHRLNTDALHYYLWNMYIPAPLSIFEGVRKVQPGQFIEYDIGDGSLRTETWWHPYDVFARGPLSLSKDDWIGRIEDLLADSVNIRMRADVPVGLFLSGGIDSSLVAAMACKIGGDVKTFSIGFEEKEYDEGGYAREIASYLGTDHQSLYCSINDARELIREIPKAYSEPFADNSQIPMLLLSRMTSDHVTVALSGDGGDEMFGGYPNVLNLFSMYRKRYLYRGAGSVLGLAGKILGKDMYSYDHWRSAKAKNIRSAKRARHLDYYTAAEIIDTILNNNDKKSSVVDAMTDEMEYGLPDADFRDQMLLKDIRYGLPDDMLTKVDRATMFCSLEARCPILDYRIVEEAIRMPLDVKYSNGNLKFILKSILEKKIPREMIDRPKRGFGIPINAWLREESFINGFMSFFDGTFIREQGLFNADGMERLMNAFFSNPSPILDRIIWNYVIFQMWWEEYCS